MSDHKPTSGALLSVVQVPPEMRRTDLAAALVEYAGVDEHAADQASRRGLPQIAALIPSSRRDDALAKLAELGVMAFAPTRDELAAFHEPVLVKRLIPFRGGGGPGRGFRAEMWRNKPEQRFVLGDVFALVRGRLNKSEVTVGPSSGGLGQALVDGVVSGWTHAGAAKLLGPGAAVGFALDAAESWDNRHDMMIGHADRSSTIRFAHVLDIYLKNGMRHRLNADKLSFDVLGERRSYTDARNMDLLVRALRRLVPGAIYDDNFRSFRLPVALRDIRTSGSGATTIRRHNQAGAFDIYSPWVFLLYSHLVPG